jgi:hypothetical protein
LRHFVELMEALPADQAAPLWQTVQAQANGGVRSGYAFARLVRYPFRAKLSQSRKTPCCFSMWLFVGSPPCRTASSRYWPKADIQFRSLMSAFGGKAGMS